MPFIRLTVSLTVLTEAFNLYRKSGGIIFLVYDWMEDERGDMYPLAIFEPDRASMGLTFLA